MQQTHLHSKRRLTLEEYQHVMLDCKIIPSRWKPIGTLHHHPVLCKWELEYFLRFVVGRIVYFFSALRQTTIFIKYTTTWKSFDDDAVLSIASKLFHSPLWCKFDLLISSFRKKTIASFPVAILPSTVTVYLVLIAPLAFSNAWPNNANNGILQCMAG